MADTDLAHVSPCPAPDARPRPPRLAPPRGACDCHAHICGPAARYPYAADRIYTPPDATIEAYQALLARLAIERAVLVQPSVYGQDNRAMLAALAAGGRGFRGIAVVPPTISRRELEALDRAGVRGVRLNLVDRRDNRNSVPIARVRALADQIALLRWHLEFLVNLDEAPDFADAFADLPVPIVLGHLGYPRAGARAFLASPAFASLTRLLDRGRCWIKLTGPYRISCATDLPYEDVDPLATALIERTPERLLWGSDWPHVMMNKPMPNDGPLLDLLSRWAPNTAVRRRILVDNPEALYGFGEDDRIAR